MRYWQDIKPGEQFTTGSIIISKQDILAFAADFDPQPYHLDANSADESIFGGLCASGWQVCAVLNRLLSDTFASSDIAFVGTQSIAELRWKIPVFANSSLSASLQVTDTQVIPNQPELGVIDCDIEVLNQDNVTVALQKCTLLVARNAMHGLATQGELA